MDQACLKATLENSESIFEFILKLKTIPRAGWQKKVGITRPESVADHAYSVAAIAMVLSDAKKLDTGKILKMAILHDLAESVIGDLTPEDGPKSKKIKLENSAMKKILSHLNAKTQKQYWFIWMQYQKNTTREAKLLHNVDKLEMALQARIYSKSFPAKKLEPFFDSARKHITDPDIKKILGKIT
ncbi:MAG: HD domain-containing protein [Thaumarchaeota archaeon]|nr:HD domain-containing protein [Nitrososphaerota archaeon]